MKKKKKTYWYFISYAHFEGSTFGFGSTEVNMTNKICNFKDIELINNWVKKNCFPSSTPEIVILNWKLYRTEVKRTNGS